MPTFYCRSWEHMLRGFTCHYKDKRDLRCHIWILKMHEQQLFCFFLCSTALMCIVKPEGPPMLCKTDEIGEIVLNSRAGGTMYYGLPGVTKNTFEVWEQKIQRYRFIHMNVILISKCSLAAGNPCKLRWHPYRRCTIHTNRTVGICGSGK